MNTIHNQLTKRLEFANNFIYLIGQKSYKYGFPKLNTHYGNRSYHRVLFDVVLYVELIKAALALYISDEHLAIIIGEYTYYWDFKYQFRLLEVLGIVYILFARIYCNLNHSKEKSRKLL